MSRSGRRRTFARIETSFVDHNWLNRIPFGPRRAHALGVWLAALCHSKLHELDGFCPTEALHAFGGGDQAIQDLVDAGLVARGERDGVVGVVVVTYADEVIRVPWDEQLQVPQGASDEAKAKHGRRAS